MWLRSPPSGPAAEPDLEFNEKEDAADHSKAVRKVGEKRRKDEADSSRDGNSAQRRFDSAPRPALSPSVSSAPLGAYSRLRAASPYLPVGEEWNPWSRLNMARGSAMQTETFWQPHTCASRTLGDGNLLYLCVDSPQTDLKGRLQRRRKRRLVAALVTATQKVATAS